MRSRPHCCIKTKSHAQGQTKCAAAQCSVLQCAAPCSLLPDHVGCKITVSVPTYLDTSMRRASTPDLTASQGAQPHETQQAPYIAFKYRHYVVLTSDYRLRAHEMQHATWNDGLTYCSLLTHDFPLETCTCACGHVRVLRMCICIRLYSPAMLCVYTSEQFEDATAECKTNTCA